MTTRTDPEHADRVMRVLVVDDDAALASGIKRALESLSYSVRTLNSGVHVADVVRVFNPDLIVLDVTMPVMDGWEVLEVLRSGEFEREVPVIMLTAADTEEAKFKGFTLGADDYVTKPFSLQELRCRIAAILHRCHRDPEEDAICKIPVVVGGTRTQFTCCKDVYYVEGVRNFSYVHTAQERFLSRLALGSVEERDLEGFLRVHRSFIVNMNHVKGCGWENKSSYRLTLDDAEGTHVPVSRARVPDVQRYLGLRA